VHNVRAGWQNTLILKRVWKPEWQMSDKTADVIIVGAGSAGLPAAIFAAQRGARVVQVEAGDRIGGTLHWSSGQMSAAGTRQQAELGIEDSADRHYRDAQRIANNTIDPVIGRLTADNAGATIDWLVDCGFELAEGTPAYGVTHELFDQKRYVWGNNQAVSVFEAIAPVHEELVNSGAIDLHLETRMTRLVADNDGSVTGIEVECNNEKRVLSAGSVVLASGGYAMNPDLWRELTPAYTLRSTGNPHSQGDGLVAALALGADCSGSENFLCTFAGFLCDPDEPRSAWFYSLDPKMRPPWEMYVNTTGHRFVREDHESIDVLEHTLVEEPGMSMFIVFDEAIRNAAPPLVVEDGPQFDDLIASNPGFHRADSLAELAAMAGMNETALANSVRKYNAAVDADHDADFGRKHLPSRIEQAPFYACEASGVTVVSPAGLHVDDQLRVLRKDGSPIPNLYAAGEVLGFGRTSGNAFVGGMSLTPALTFGRLLGESILEW
jgi:fumarate reductase flavoprotein subunit